jgi:membrane-anchored glycerophosphoryl diester phosphodiesterase (GDPDase)
VRNQPVQGQDGIDTSWYFLQAYKEFFQFAKAVERTQDLSVFIYFLVTLPLSHSGSPTFL